MLHAEIISIGEELLSSESETIDTNSVFITKALGSIGIRVIYKTTVGDDETRITDVIRLALSRADVIITTGGLGPTVDDMTRQGVANAVGVGLAFRQDLMDDIAAKFAKFTARMPDNNRVQAMLPDGAEVIYNPAGTAPGFTVHYNGKVIMSLPGVPREMKAMIDQSVIPTLREKSGVRVIRTRVLRTAGIGESWIDEQIGHLERLQNPTVGLNAHSGQTDIRITARTGTEAEADALIAAVEREVREKLGEYIYGVDKEALEQAFADALCGAGLRAAIAEIGTEGALRRRVEKATFATPGAVMFVAPETAAELRAPYGPKPDYKPMIEALAAHVRATTGADIGIMVVTEPDGTAIGVATPTENRSRVYAYGSGTGAQEWAGGWGLSVSWDVAHRMKR